MVVAQALDEIATDKFHVIEFRKIKNMRFRQHGRRNIQRLADLGKILEKMRIRQLFGIFIHELSLYSPVRHQLCPDPHTLYSLFLLSFAILLYELLYTVFSKK